MKRINITGMRIFLLATMAVFLFAGTFGNPDKQDIWLLTSFIAGCTLWLSTRIDEVGERVKKEV